MISKYLRLNQKQDSGKRGLGGMDDRFVVASVSDFVRELATFYLPRGYWFYVSGLLRDGKGTKVVGSGVVQKCRDGSAAQMPRFDQGIEAGDIQYLRFERTFILLALDRRHLLLEDQRDHVQDARCVPIRFRGYSIGGQRCGAFDEITPNTDACGCSEWRVHVQIEPDLYHCIEAYFLAVATRRSTDQLADDLRALPYEPYAGVRSQLQSVFQLINGVRDLAGLPLLDDTVLMRRRPTTAADKRLQTAADRRCLAGRTRCHVVSQKPGRLSFDGPLTSRTRRRR